MAVNTIVKLQFLSFIRELILIRKVAGHQRNNPTIVIIVFLFIFCSFVGSALPRCTWSNLEAGRSMLTVPYYYSFYISRLSILHLFVWLQLGRCGCIPNCAYYFVDRNDWPISADQENDLHVIDALQNMCVKIACTADVESRSPAVIQKTSVTTVKLKRSFSVEPSTTKRPRLVFHFKFSSEHFNLTPT